MKKLKVSSYIALGGNLGDVETTFKKSIQDIHSDKVKVQKVSSFFKTKPVGYAEQPDFLNAVIKVETTFSPLELLKFLQTIEKKYKKDKKFLNGPRTLDLDILTYGNSIIKTKKLTVPHPRMFTRDFVLNPLKEVI